MGRRWEMEGIGWEEVEELRCEKIFLPTNVSGASNAYAYTHTVYKFLSQITSACILSHLHLACCCSASTVDSDDKSTLNVRKCMQ